MIFAVAWLRKYTIRRDNSYQIHTINDLVIAEYSVCGNGWVSANTKLIRQKPGTLPRLRF
jgi:hypothetical protein